MSVRIIQIVKVVLWSVPAFLLLWLLQNNFVPGGKLTVRCGADICSKLVSVFASKEPDMVIGETKDHVRYRLITQDPVYVTVKTPKAFFKASVRAEFHPDGQPVINFGLLGANSAYTLKNVYAQSDTIEALDKKWEAVREKDVILYTRPDKKSIQQNNNSAANQDVRGNKNTDVDQPPAQRFARVEDFLSSLPPIDKIRTHNYDLSPYVKLKEYAPSNTLLEINFLLRGPHEFLTYLENEPLEMSFVFQDINRHNGADDVKVVVSRNGKTVLEKTLPDDGVVKNTGVVKEPRTLELKASDLSAGVYTVSIAARDDDIFIRKIATRQHLLMLKSHVYLAGNDEYRVLGNISTSPTTLLTTGLRVSARTSHPQNLQTITVNKKALVMKEIHKEYELTRSGSGLATVTVPKSDVYLSGDGYFVFDTRQAFDPSLKVPSIIDAGISDAVSYVIARYPRPKELGGGWLEASTEFSDKEMYRSTDGTYTLILQVPGLAENKRFLKLRALEVTFERDPITMSNAWEKIINKFK